MTLQQTPRTLHPVMPALAGIHVFRSPLTILKSASAVPPSCRTRSGIHDVPATP